MNSLHPRNWHLHATPHNSKMLSFIIVLLVALFIPLSVTLTEQQQDLRQEAKGRNRNDVSIQSNRNNNRNGKGKNSKNGKNGKNDNKKNSNKKDNGKKNHKKPSKTKQAKNKRGKIQGDVLVKVKDPKAFAKQAAAIEGKVKSKHRGKVRKRYASIGWQSLDVPAGTEQQVIDDLKTDPNVSAVEQDSYTTVLDVPNDPEFDNQYAFRNTGQAINDKNGNPLKGKPGADISLTSAWDVTKGSDQTKIAILDTGIQTNHPDLVGKVIKSVKIADVASTEDSFGHGTHVAGIIAANTNNGTDVAGVCPKCRLINIKVMNDQGYGNQPDMAEGVLKAIDLGADVINMSIGSPNESQMLKDAIDKAIGHGIVVVAAAGNCGIGAGGCNGVNTKYYPAYYDAVISVGATDNNDHKPDYSNSGTWVDVAAPGDAILSLYINSGVAIENGTSMATPMVSGLAGLLKSTPYGKNAAMIRDRIQSTADKISGTGKLWRYGRINAARAVGAKNTPTPKPSANPSQKPSSTPTGIHTTPGTNPSTTLSPTISGATPGISITPGHATATPNPLAANINLVVFINGIGGGAEGGLAGGNNSPNHPTRSFVLEVIGNGGKVVQTVQANLSFLPGIGGFSGIVSLSNIQSGSYAFKVQGDGTLKKQIPGIFAIAQTKTIKLPGVTLPIGDLNKDNKVDILDFNILAGCYSVQQAAKTCTTTLKQISDLNDDGRVDGIDYNLFVKNLAVLKGD